MSTQTVDSAAVLVVDDDKLSRQLLERRLQRCGYLVTVAADGPRALALIQQQSYDLVLLDVSMPGADGLEVLSVIRQTHSVTALPVVMATAKDSSADIVKAMKLGANDYVTKPLDLPIVIARVETQLLVKHTIDRIRRLERDLAQQNRAMQEANAQILADNDRLRQQQEEVERLLDGALTWPVARVFRETGSYPPTLDEVCIIATDIIGFSTICQTLTPKRVVDELNRFYKTFDQCCLPYEVEPLRSQGDSRIAIAGLHGGMRQSASIPVVDAILAMLSFRDALLPVDQPHSGQDAQDGRVWSARIGIHSGPAMIGVMSGTRLCLDVWGNTVNIAARLEQGAEANQILVSDRVLSAARGLFDHGPIRQIQIKKTVVHAAAVRGIRAEFCDSDGKPNDAFWTICRGSDRAAMATSPADSRRCDVMDVSAQSL